MAGPRLATRAVRLACRYLHDRDDVAFAVIRTDPHSRASAAVAERAGFTPATPRWADAGEPMNVWTLTIRRFGCQ